MMTPHRNKLLLTGWQPVVAARVYHNRVSVVAQVSANNLTDRELVLISASRHDPSGAGCKGRRRRMTAVNTAFSPPRCWIRRLRKSTGSNGIASELCRRISARRGSAILHRLPHGGNAAPCDCRDESQGFAAPGAIACFRAPLCIK
jgi:hypothetical protein